MEVARDAGLSFRRSNLHRVQGCHDVHLSLAPGLEISPQIADMAGVCAAGRLKLLEPCIRLAGADGLSGRKNREVSRNVSLHFLLDFHDEKVQFCFEKGRVCYNTGTISLVPLAAAPEYAS